MSRLAPYLPLGQIVKPQGIRGEVKVYAMTDDISRFHQLKTVFLCKNGAYQPYEVRAVRIQGDFVYLLLAGVESRNDAETLRDEYLYIDRAHAARLPKGRYYICDIVGCRIVDENGKDYGAVTEVIQTGSNDVYVVNGEKEWLLPALKVIISAYDVEAGIITIRSAALPEVDPDAY